MLRLKKMLETKIESIIKKDLITKRYFLGAIAFDELPIIESYPASFIINTKPRSNEGEHWLALYFNEKKFCYFFDSYGLSPSYHKLVNYINSYSVDFNYNMKSLQEIGSLVCGEYCIMFLYYISRKDLKSFYNNFSINVKKNDICIKYLLKYNFLK